MGPINNARDPLDPLESFETCFSMEKKQNKTKYSQTGTNSQFFIH